MPTEAHRIKQETHHLSDALKSIEQTLGSVKRMCAKHMSPQIRNKPTGIGADNPQSPLKCHCSPQNHQVRLVALQGGLLLLLAQIALLLPPAAPAPSGMKNQGVSLKGDLLSLEATAAATTATTSTTVTEATATTATSTTVAEAATATTTAATVAKATTSTATTAAATEATTTATAAVVGSATGVVKTDTTTHQVSALQLLDGRLRLLDRVEGDVTETLETSSLPV
jgi:cytoskeletal protein RodZ